MDLQQKTLAYCDINEIAHPEKRQEYAKNIVELPDYIQTMIARNTQDFLAKGVRDVHHGHIQDEVFFQLGDISSTTNLKIDRPFLDALEKLQEHIEKNTVEENAVYVIEQATKIAYVHLFGEKHLQELLKNLEEKKSVVLFI